MIRHDVTLNIVGPYNGCRYPGVTLYILNSLRPRQNRRHFAEDVFKCIFLTENVRISIKISLKFVPKGPINNNPALVHIMAWRWSGDRPLSEPMMNSLLTHICVTRPKWVKCRIDTFHKQIIRNTLSALKCFGGILFYTKSVSISLNIIIVLLKKRWSFCFNNTNTSPSATIVQISHE